MPSVGINALHSSFAECAHRSPSACSPVILSCLVLGRSTGQFLRVFVPALAEMDDNAAACRLLRVSFGFRLPAPGACVKGLAVEGRRRGTINPLAGARLTSTGDPLWGGGERWEGLGNLALLQVGDQPNLEKVEGG